MGDLKGVLPVLLVRDMDRSVAFYGEHLGFTVAWRLPGDREGENCMLRAGRVSLLLSTGSHLGDAPAFTGTLYFDVDDVEARFAALKDRVKIVWPLEVMEYGNREFGFRDPDGYVLALAQEAARKGA